MEKIIFPLQFQDKGLEVKNLHEVLIAINEKLDDWSFMDLLEERMYRTTFDAERERTVYGEATRQAITSFQENYMKITPNGEVDEPTAAALNALPEEYGLIKKIPVTYVVRGNVYDELLQPLAKATIRAFDKGMRKEILLGEAATDEKGAYSIHFGPDKFNKAGKDTPDVVVVLYARNGKPVKISDVFYNAPLILQVDLNLANKAYAGPSEFERVVASVTPLIGKMTIDRLTENEDEKDISFLTKKTGLPQSSVTATIQAYRYEKWTDVTAPFFYAMLRQDVGGSMAGSNTVVSTNNVAATDFDETAMTRYNALWNVPVAAMMNALQQSIDANIVPYAITDQMQSIGEQLEKLILDPPLAPGQKEPASPVYQKIKLAGLSDDQQTAFFRLNPAAGMEPGFWDRLKEDPAFVSKPAAADKLQAVFQLITFTGDNIALAGVVMKQNKINSMDKLPSLAGMDAAAWKQVLTDNNLTGSIPGNVNIGEYTTHLVNTFEQVYPMPAFTGKIGRAAVAIAAAANSAATTNSTATAKAASGKPAKTKPAKSAKAQSSKSVKSRAASMTKAGSSKTNKATSAVSPPLHWTAGVSTFLSNNPSFDFANDHVNLYLGEKGVKLPKGTDKAMLANQLMGVQRLYKLAPNYDGVASLVQDGVLSARQIFAMGKSNFTAKYQDRLGQHQPDDVYEKATMQYGGALTIVGRLNSMRSASSITSFADFSHSFKDSPVVNAYPDLNGLFGLSDYCECKDCHSFTSPSAYLTDILEFLNHRASTYTTGGSYTVREILLANGHFPLRLPSRRPDIGDIDLNCDNTNILVPYIDLVNELLEDYIAPPVFEIPNSPLAGVDFAAGPISANLLNVILDIQVPPAVPPLYNAAIYNIALLTNNAIVSAPFKAVEFPYQQIIIRDKLITLKISYVPAGRNIDGGTDGPYDVQVAELHETHLPADQIRANPEYVNTNVYNRLRSAAPGAYKNSIPFGLPFDLYFTEANTFLDKMGIHQYDLKQIFRKENQIALDAERSQLLITSGYLGLSIKEAILIFLPSIYDPTPKKLWGAVLLNQINTGGGAEVDTFLQYTGLDYKQLVSLLSLVSVNGPDAASSPPKPGMSMIVHLDSPLSCDTSKMVITDLLADSEVVINEPVAPPNPPPALIRLTRLNLINRLLRLWQKTTLTLPELDACLMAPAIGNGHIDANFAVQLQYFLQLKDKLSESIGSADIGVMPVLSLFQGIDVSGKNGLYHQLFQNPALSNPVNPKLTIVNFDGTDIDDAGQAPGVVQIILTACGITDADLQFLLAIIRGGVTGAPAPINIDNLSFIYRWSLLAKALALSVSDLFTLVGLIGIVPALPIPAPAVGILINPEATWRFLEKFTVISKAGFSVDALNYALTNQSNGWPSLVPDTSTITSGLIAIRTAIQGAVAGATVVADPKGLLLTQWLNDPVLNWDNTISARLLKLLSTADDATYTEQLMENGRFLQLLSLNYPGGRNTSYLQSLPVISFPDKTVTGLDYDDVVQNIGFAGTMTVDQQTYLLSLSGPGPYQAAITALYIASQAQPFSVAPLAALPAGVVIPDKNVPSLSVFTGTLRFTGPMSGPVYSALRGESADIAYRYALDRLFVYSQDFLAAGIVSVPLIAMPVMAFPDSTITTIAYIPPAGPAPGQLTYDGAMSWADYQALLALSVDVNYTSALQELFGNAHPEKKSSAGLVALPPWNFLFPDANAANLSYAGGLLQFKGVMSTADLTALLALSSDADYQAAVADLFVLSKAGTVSTPLPAGLPAPSIEFPDANILSATLSGGNYMFTGLMSVADLKALLALSIDVNYQTAMCNLFALSKEGSTVSVTPAVLPAPAVTFPDSSILKITYAPGSLSITGVMSTPTRIALQGLSPEAAYTIAIQNLYTASLASLPSQVVAVPLAPPASWTFSFPDNKMSGMTYDGINLSFAGAMSVADFRGLMALETDAAYQTAVRRLFARSLLNPILNLTPLIAPARCAFAFPDSNILNLSYSKGILYYTGQMSPTDLTGLLALDTALNYQTAIRTLYAQSQINPVTTSVAVTLAPIALPDNKLAKIGYTKGMLLCNRILTIADLNNLVQANADPAQQTIIAFLHGSVLAISATTLSALPPITLPTMVGGLVYGNGTLSLTGKMTAADLATLLSLSADPGYQATINRLAANSLLNSAATVNTIVLPVLPLVSVSAVANMKYANGILSINGAMTAAVQKMLLDLSQYDDYQTAVNELFVLSNLPAVAGSISFMYPDWLAPLDLRLLTAPASVVYSGGCLNCPSSPLSLTDYRALTGLSPDAVYSSAVNDLYLKSLAVAAGTPVNSFPLALPVIVFPSLYSSQLNYDPSLQTLRLAGYIAAADQSALLSLSSDTYYEESVSALYSNMNALAEQANIVYRSFSPDVAGDLLTLIDGNAPDALIPMRFAYFLKAIQPVYEALKKTTALQTQVSNIFQIKTPVAARLLSDLADGVYAVFTDKTFIQSSRVINELSFFTPFYYYLYCARIAFFVNRFKMSADDLSWLLANGGSVGGIDFLSLPGNWQASGGANNPNATFSQWEMLNGYYVFQKKYRPVTIADPANSGRTLPFSVFSIVQQAWSFKAGLAPVVPGAPVVVPDPGAFLNAVLQLTGWKNGDLLYLLNLAGAPPVNPLNLPVDNPVLGSVMSMADPYILNRLVKCMEATKLLGITAARAYAWSSPERAVTIDLAEDIKQGLKARYGMAAQWASVIIPLQNKLREVRRDAMVKYALANPATADKFRDEYDVYSKLLIYLEMSSCQPTTRIVQAYCSVQLFVQRCLMNLEPQVTIVTHSTDINTVPDEDWSQWAWMNTYEKWKQNRMIFLYPENYIRPELLTGQSPFYKDLRNDLTQNAVTKDLAETAITNYTVSLDTVAQLQVKGQWYDEATDTLHVFACTYGGNPYVYYYRRRDINGIWTAWEKVDLDIQDGIVVPAVINGRLFLFWPVFKKMSVDNTDQNSGSDKADSKTPRKYWNIGMSYSEYRKGTWSAKKISGTSINSMLITDGEQQAIFPDKSDFVFIPWDIPDGGPGNNVTIGCYYVNNNWYTRDLFISSSYLTLKDKDKLYNTLAQSRESLPTLVTLFHDAPDTHNYFNIYNISGKSNAFRFNACSGFPEAVVLDQPLVVSESQFFGSEGTLPNFMANMLNHGTTPLVFKRELAKIIQPAPVMTYDNAASLQMSSLDKYFFNTTASYNVGTLLPFFYTDSKHTFFVVQEFTQGSTEYSYADCRDVLDASLKGLPIIDWLAKKLNNYLAGALFRDVPVRRLYNFRHSYACSFIQLLFNGGVEALQKRDVQLQGDAFIGTGDGGYQFSNMYNPTELVYTGDPVTYWNGFTDPAPAYPKDDVDFDFDASYGLYNWELFFHGVLLTAMNLSQNQQFEESDRWFKYIFNPTDTSSYPSPQKYWVTKPFFVFASNDMTMTELITQLDLGTAPLSFVRSVTAMRQDPFDPFCIANDRIAPYMVTTVMKYMDNLLAWGDALFTEHTMESVNQAIQVYLLVQELLGREPQAIPPGEKVPVMNYYQLEASLSTAIGNNAVTAENPWPSLSDPLVLVESMVPLSATPISQQEFINRPRLPTIPSLLYFCIPPNQQLFQYWKTVADRLYKIRHCENILGQYDPLSPFGDGSDAALADADDLNDLNGLQLYYRFTVMIQKATELCNEVKSLGAELLSALEKQDAEELALIRAGQEVKVQNAIMQVRELQITEAQDNLANLNDYMTLVKTKIGYYEGLLMTPINALEAVALGLNMAASVIDDVLIGQYSVAAPLNLIPMFLLGVSGIASPVAVVAEGGANFSSSARDAASVLSSISTALDKTASVTNLVSSYQRRAEEWKFQLDLANAELAQVQSQLLAGFDRVQIALQEQANQQLQIDNANEIDSFLSGKFTSKELYSWMVSQISNVYFKSYQLAYGIAKRAETCFRFELGLADSSYINFGYWNSLKSGLLSGDQLLNDIKQMEMDYMQLNAREFELAKHISLAQFDPVALLQLKQTGACFINFPEELFDMDYPGHYFRRIKSVSLTIPCVAGPYTTVSCTLTLTNNSIRISNDASGKYPRKKNASGKPADDNRFGDNAGMLQSIATSSGLNDSGLFELNFRDERYLPFEFVGAISGWYIQMPAVPRQFDYDSISDLIVHVKYTARDGGNDLLLAAQDHLQSSMASSLTTPGLGLYRLFSAKRDFPSAWYQFLHSVDGDGNQRMELDLTERFPYFTKTAGLTVQINRMDLLAKSGLAGINLNVADPNQSASAPSLSGTNNTNDDFGGLLYSSQVFGMSKPPAGVWKVTYSAANNAANPDPLNKDNIGDLFIVVYYNLVQATE